jgi:putative ABC transport system permease protein
MQNLSLHTISYQGAALALLMLLIPIGILLVQKLNLKSQLLTGALRMVLQLATLGLVLEFLFGTNHWALNCGWLLVMLTAATQSILARTGIKIRRLPVFLLTVLLLAVSVVLSFCLLIVIGNGSIMEAQYFIPLGGMILGNSMNGTTLALDSFYRSLTSEEGKTKLETWLSLGATPTQARFAFERQSMKTAMLPTLNTLATIGLVHIPGMMTGQILSGTLPVKSVAYQGMIMLAILASVSLSSFLVVKVIGRLMIGPDGLLNHEKLQH